MARIDDVKSGADHVEAISDEVHAHLRVAAEEELGKGQSVWKVLIQNPRAFSVVVVVLATAILQGAELSMSGSMLGSQAFCKVMGAWDETSQAYVVAAGHVSAWNAGATPSQFFGYYMAGILSDRYGRKMVIIGSMGLIVIGAIIETESINWKIWLLSKVVMGIATGSIMASSATYVAEVSPRELRGGCLIGYQFFTNLGNLVAAIALDLSAKTWSDPSNPLQWKIPLYIMIALPVVMSAAAFVMLVESPSWLVIKNRLPDAMKSLQWIYPWMTTDDLELELAKLQYTVDKERMENEANRGESWLACLQGSNLRRTGVAMIPALAWVLAGNVVLILSAYFFSLAGESNALQSTVIVQCTGIAVNLFAAILVENQRIGRWLILVVGLFIQTGGMFMIGAVGARWGSTIAGNAVAGNLVIAGVVISNIGCQLGPQAVSFLYASESGSSRLRAKTTSISMSIGSLVGQCTSILFPFILEDWGTQVGFFFGGFGALFLIICLVWVPDYTGRSHAQIDELYARKIPARKFASTDCTGNYGSNVLHDEVSATEP
ncbi:hypothetical protein ASPZODRAFT_15498 [Penicilliopsis zonata CBS 506.65]|uniref:Major facilitator superfamily (MFS) profile domain-containing protein n=1 Tax=Penicilliopsis zonata CBS 506.65 TaxID=1073090 RepID=A0A1L9SLN7_9EURO|nr:hypothetical protein ASPZODRAFT_15498 [Penicilliopsis zonata CBS 506.65]OJJ48053.1 hypothetical protein ASPZODRAFT_15498 [Penicilliopsis zonata CBS 506.65]